MRVIKYLGKPIKQPLYMRSHTPYHSSTGCERCEEQDQPSDTNPYFPGEGSRLKETTSDSSSFWDATEPLQGPSAQVCGLICCCCTKCSLLAYLKFTREFEICVMTHLITDSGAVGAGKTGGDTPR